MNPIVRVRDRRPGCLAQPAAVRQPPKQHMRIEEQIQLVFALEFGQDTCWKRRVEILGDLNPSPHRAWYPGRAVAAQADEPGNRLPSFSDHDFLALGRPL